MYVPSVFTMSASSTPATWLFVPEYGTLAGVEAPGPVNVPRRTSPKIHGQPLGFPRRWAFSASRLSKCWRSPQSRSGIVSWRGTEACGSPAYTPTAARPAATRTAIRTATFLRDEDSPVIRNSRRGVPGSTLIPFAFVRGYQNRGGPAEALFPWPRMRVRAGRGPVLRREGLDVRGARRPAAGLGCRPARLDPSGGPRLDAVPRAGPPRRAPPCGGDGVPPDHGEGGGGGGRGARGPGAGVVEGGRGRGRRRRDRLGLPAQPRERGRARARTPGVRAPVAGGPRAAPAGLPRGGDRSGGHGRLRGRHWEGVARAETRLRSRRRATRALAKVRREPVRGGRGVRDPRHVRPVLREKARGRAGGAAMGRRRGRLRDHRGPARPRVGRRGRTRATVVSWRKNSSRSSPSGIRIPASYAFVRWRRRSRRRPARASARARASYANARGKPTIPFVVHVRRHARAWCVAGSSLRRTAYTWETCHSPIARFTGVPTTPQWWRDAWAAWTIHSSSRFERRRLSRRRQTALNRSTAAFRCHSSSVSLSFDAIRRTLPRVEWGCPDLNRGLRLFRRQRGGPKARRIPSYPTAPRSARTPGFQINRLPTHRRSTFGPPTRNVSSTFGHLSRSTSLLGMDAEDSEGCGT